MTKDDIQLLYEFDRWANNRVLHAVSTLSAEKFTRDLGGSFRSVRDTLVHIVGAEWAWLTYWMEPSPNHYRHPEDKSLSPDGQRCGPYTRGLLLRRPIEAIAPFRTIGKEIERKAQEDEDISIIENRGPVEYAPRQTLRTRAADPRLIVRGKRFGVRPIMRVSGKSQRAVKRFLSGARVHPSTRARLAQAIEKMEREDRNKPRPSPE